MPQAISVWTAVDQVLAQKRSLWAVARRAAERKGFVERGEVDLSSEEIEREQEKQFRLLDHEAIDIINEILKDEKLTPEMRAMLDKLRFSDQSKS